MAEKKNIPETEKLAKKETRFSKAQLIKSERFRERKDMLNAILSDGRKYAISEVEQQIEKYRKGKVK